MKKRSFAAGMLTMALLFSLVATAYAAYQKQAALTYSDIKITLNGAPIIPKNANGETVDPFSIDGTTYLPVRAIGNALDLDVTWDQEQNTIVLKSRDLTDGHKDNQIPDQFYDGYVIPAVETIEGIESYSKRTVFTDGTGVAYYYDIESNSDLMDKYDLLLKQYGFLVDEDAGLSKRYIHPVSGITVSLDVYGQNRSLMVVLNVPQKVAEVAAPNSSGNSGNDSSHTSGSSSSDDRAQRYDAYKQEYDSVNADYSSRISALRQEKYNYKNELFQSFMKSGVDSYHANVDANDVANKRYDPQIKALEEEQREALAQLKLKYGL